MDPDELESIWNHHELLKFNYGINFRDLNSEEFWGFGRHVVDYFGPLGINLPRFKGPPVAWENSIDNPDARKRAHEILAQRAASAGQGGPNYINRVRMNTGENACTTPPEINPEHPPVPTQESLAVPAT